MDNSVTLSVKPDERFTATNVAKCLGLKRDDVLEFLRLRGYIMRDSHRRPSRKGDFIGTALGIEKGYVKNYIYSDDNTSSVHFYLTKKGMDKVEKAFLIDKPTQAEKERIDSICREYEKNMKPSVLGKAE